MTAALFLTGRVPVAVADELWGISPLRFSWYLTPDQPPAALVTSVRAIVLRDDMVLVLREPDGRPYIVPGGHCEAGESHEETVRREVLEEAGWALGPLAPLGCYNLHNLGPEPPRNRYPYPDSFHTIYAAEATDYCPQAKVFDQWVASSEFVPLTEALLLPLRPGERAFLVAALDGR
jgi:8-oxo-dGTP pyrophosphatase MutT (NUDIX family)